MPLPVRSRGRPGTYALLGLMGLVSALTAYIGLRSVAWETTDETERRSSRRDLVAELPTAPPAARPEMLEALGRLRDPAAVAAIAPYTRSKLPDERRAAIHALGRILDTRARLLLEQGLRDPDRQVRRLAALGLWKHCAPESIPALQAALDDPDPGVHRQVEQALRAISTPEAQPAPPHH